MVQVDVFWAYAMGAGCGAAAAREPARRLLDDRRLTATVLFLGCVFVPSGGWLLWRVTPWGTMPAAGRPPRPPRPLVARFPLAHLNAGVPRLPGSRARWPARAP